jgi:hypothetical protein
MVPVTACSTSIVYHVCSTDWEGGHRSSHHDKTAMLDTLVLPLTQMVADVCLEVAAVQTGQALCWADISFGWHRGPAHT